MCNNNKPAKQNRNHSHHCFKGTIEVTFSDAVEILGSSDEPLIGIALVDENGKQVYDEESRAIFFRGSWEYKDDNKKTIVWTFPENNSRDSKNLSDVFNFEGDLKAFGNSKIVFLICDTEDNDYGKEFDMLINGVTDSEGIMHLTANMSTALSEYQSAIEIQYELPAIAEDVIEEEGAVEETTGPNKEKSNLWIYIVASAIIVIFIIVGIIIKKRKKD